MSVIESALAQVKRLHPYTPGKPVEELERDLGISNAIKLASNENPLGCSDLAKQAIKSASNNIELYPDANAFYLKQTLAHKLGLQAGQITIGNGSNDALDLVNQSQDVAKIKHIYSHQQSFAQCRHWLDQNFPSIERIPVSSNAEAARITSQDKHAAAICGLPAVEIFDLLICFENIEDLSDNTTRFVIIGNQDVDPSGDDKTSLLISTKNTPGTRPC